MKMLIEFSRLKILLYFSSDRFGTEFRYLLLHKILLTFYVVTEFHIIEKFRHYIRTKQSMYRLLGIDSQHRILYVSYILQGALPPVPPLLRRAIFRFAHSLAHFVFYDKNFNVILNVIKMEHFYC